MSFSGSFNAIAVTHAQFSGFQVASSRLILASLLLFLFSKARIDLKKAWIYRKSLLKGSLWLAIHFALWTCAFAFTKLSSAIIFLSAQPLAACILTYRNPQERVTWSIGLSLLLGLVGLTLLGWQDFQISAMALCGDLMVVGACFAIVFYQLETRQANRELSWPVFNGCVWGLAGLMLLIFSWPWNLSAPNKGWFAILGLIFLPTLIGHGCFNLLIPRLKLTLINIAVLIEPVLGIAIGTWMGLDHWPQGQGLLGAFLVFIAVAFSLTSEIFMSRKAIK